MSATGPEQGARALVGSALCVLATWASLLALGGLVTGLRWFVVACVAVLVVAGTTAFVRALTHRWWVPSLVGAVVAAVGLVLRYGSPPGRPQFLPDLEAVGRAWTTLQQGVVVVNESFVPMPDVRPGEMLLVLGAVAVVLLVDAAVLALRVPAVAGLPLLALWVPAVVLGFPAGAAPAFWGAAAYLALLAYGAAPLHARAGRARRVLTAVVAGALLAGGSLVAGPPLRDAPGWASIELPTFGDTPAGPLELSDDLDLRESLGRRSGQVVLTYRVEALATELDEDPAAAPAPDEDATDPAPSGIADAGGATPPPDGPAVDARLVGPLRSFTLATFDGRSWERTEAEQVDDWAAPTLLSSDPGLRGLLPDRAAGTLAQVDVEVGALSERRLPIATFPRTVEVNGAWGYDARRDEVVGRRATAPGTTYSMVVQVPSLTADDLRGARVGVPDDAELYTAVPDTEHGADVAALAAEVTADASGPYEQALDLQTWLRSTANFTYDTRVPPARTQDAVWDFLEDRRGYCVQFATAMAMMARTLDIPSRVGVGFLPGERRPDGTYAVTGRLAHAWPELFFEGQGWVRFEPTPASQTGPPPVWANPFSAAPSAEPTPGPDEAAVPETVPTSAPDAPGTSVTPEDESSGSWVPLLVVVLLVAAAAAATGVVVLRRRRRTAASAEHAWLLLRRDLARVDVRWSDATSPRGALREVQRALVARGGRELDGAPLEAFERLVRAVEQARYAPAPAPVDPADVDAWWVAVRGGVREALTDDTVRQPAPVA